MAGMEGNGGTDRSLATVVLAADRLEQPIVARQVNGDTLSFGFTDGPVTVWLTGTPAELAAFFRDGMSAIAGIR